MADDKIRATAESTEKDDQNNDTESQNRRIQDRDGTISLSEATPRSEEKNVEVNDAIEKLKADQATLKKNLSESKLESGESIGSSSVADDMLSERIGFDQNMSRAKLSGEQFEVGGSSTKQEDQNDGSDDEFLANISKLSSYLRNVDRTITRIEATPTTEEEAEEVNAALKQLKADHVILKRKFSELNLRFPESARSSAEQQDHDDAIEDEIRTNISNLSRCVQDIERAVACMLATPTIKEQTEKLNAAFQLLRDGQVIVKNNLARRKLEAGKSVGSSSVADEMVGLDDIRDDWSIVKKQLGGLQSVVVGSSSPTADKAIIASESTQQDYINEEKMEKLKALSETFDTAEDAVKTKLNELQREFSKFMADYAVIKDFKSSEENQETRLDQSKKRFGDSMSDIGEFSNSPKRSKEMQKSVSEIQGDSDSDSGESMTEEQRRAIAVLARLLVESIADTSSPEGGVMSGKLTDSIERDDEFVHTSSVDTEEVKDVPVEGSEPETSCPTFDLVDQAMQQVEDVMREVRQDLEAANPTRLNEIRPVITAIIASLAALCAVFCGRAKGGKGKGGNKD